MVLTRVQASDFQEAGVKGNLSKLEIIAKSAGESKPAGVDLVGDIFDYHSMDDIQKQLNKGETASRLESDPNIKALLEENRKVGEALSKKYGESFKDRIKNKQLEPGELQMIQRISQGIQSSGLMQAQMEDYMGAVQTYYQLCAKAIGSISSPVYAIRGNNDWNFMQDIIKSAKYPELERKLIEDGPFKIIGMNNTNLPGEVIQEYGQMGVPSDSKQAYETYNLQKTGGKKANIIMMHDPPTMPGAEDVLKLVEEHAPSNGYLLVEFGHLDKTARLEVKTTKDGRKMVFARSSMNIFFEHSFDDKGNYLYSDMYKYKLN
jgi:Icc-related predicted phosphoesterase